LEIATSGLASNALTSDCLASGLPEPAADVDVAACEGVSSAGLTSTTGTATSATSNATATGQRRRSRRSAQMSSTCSFIA
jgi:hypothetical protein